jgi:hypothetical protein
MLLDPGSNGLRNETLGSALGMTGWGAGMISGAMTVLVMLTAPLILKWVSV